MIDFRPVAGLCNRMQATESAIALAKDLQTPLHIYWVRDHALNCRFDRLWQPISDPQITLTEHTEKPLRFLLAHDRARALRLHDLPGIRAFSLNAKAELESFDFKTLRPTTRILIESFLRFYPISNTFSHLKPISSIVERISERTSSFDNYTIGVHVRRTDNKVAIRYSTDELFIESMKKEIEMEPRTTFYLATDDQGVKLRFKKIFDAHIITTPYDVSRLSEEGIQEAMVELYALSKTRKIIGSYWSSYTRVAGELGNTEVVRLKKL